MTGPDIARDDDELGPFTEARLLDDTVVVVKKTGNLVQKVRLDEDDVDELKELLTG